MTTIQTSKGKGTQWLLIGGVAHGETLWVKGGDSQAHRKFFLMKSVLNLLMCFAIRTGIFGYSTTASLWYL